MSVWRRVLLFLAGSALLALLCEMGYRAKLQHDLPRPEPGGTSFEIYGVGESTLIGEPFQPKISVPQLLNLMFGGRIAGRTVVLKNLAVRGQPLYPQSIAFDDAVEHRDPHVPGVVLIMSGHNEGIPPGQHASRPYLPSFITEKSVLLRDLVLALRRRHIIGREKSLAAYEYYLRHVIQTAKNHGLLPILATMASNISRIEPNDGGGDPGTVDLITQRGYELEALGRFAEAESLYMSRLKQGARSAAWLYYRAGRCEEALGRFAAAREYYWTAVDLDPRTMFGRATRSQNQLVRHLANEYRLPLVDVVQLFEAHAPQGIPGDDLFMDGQHPTLAGYVLLTNAYARILEEQFKTPVTHPLRSPQEAAAALGFEQHDLAGAMVDAGSWLIVTAIGHPSPRDRMVLAGKRFASMVGDGDDFSAWVGIALTQAVVRGGMLRNPSDVPKFAGAYTQAYRVEPSELPSMLSRFQNSGVDKEVIARVQRAF